MKMPKGAVAAGVLMAVTGVLAILSGRLFYWIPGVAWLAIAWGTFLLRSWARPTGIVLAFIGIVWNLGAVFITPGAGKLFSGLLLVLCFAVLYSLMGDEATIAAFKAQKSEAPPPAKPPEPPSAGK